MKLSQNTKGLEGPTRRVTPTARQSKSEANLTADCSVREKQQYRQAEALLKLPDAEGACTVPATAGDAFSLNLPDSLTKLGSLTLHMEGDTQKGK